MKPFRLLAATLLFGAGFLLSSCGEEDPVDVHIALPKQPSSALALIAQHKGFFEDEGLSGSISFHPSGKRALNDSLLIGTSDFTVSSDVPIVSALIQGKEIAVLASIGSTDNQNSIVARKSAGISTPRDLAGKHIATQAASAVHFFMHTFLTKYGIHDDLEKSFMKAEKLVAALEEGRIDAFSMREPYVGQAVRSLGDDVIVFESPGDYVQHDLLIARKEFLAEEPDAAERLLRALVKAEEFAVSSPEEAQEIVADVLEADVETVRQSWGARYLVVSLPQSLMSLFADIVEWIEAENFADNEGTPNLLPAFETEPLSAVSKSRVSLIK